MNTYPLYSSVTESFTYPNTPDGGSVSVVVTYDFGDTVVAAKAPTLVSGDKYSIAISDDLLGAAGIYRIKWSCTFSGTSFYNYTEFKLEDIYITSEEFFNNNPEYDYPEYTVKFDANEKLARRIIDTYCGQDFQCIKNKSISYDGNGREKIYLGSRLNNLSQVIVGDSDFTERTVVDLRSKYFIKLNTDYPYFDSRRDDLIRYTFPVHTIVTVTGDWGWLSVPWEIKQASELLICDLLNDVKRENRRYGVTRMEQDSLRIHFDPSILNSTGNIDVDTLLMDFVVWTMDYVI
jgi:hypothetical protein